MKSKVDQQKKWGTSVLLAPILLTALCLSKPAFSQVDIAGSWELGTSHTKEGGTNRVLIFIAHGERTGDMNLASVTYGGQAMTKIIDRNYYSGSGAYAYAAAYILNEVGVTAATDGTFVPTWSTTPTEVGYASVFLSSVNQTTLTRANASNGDTSDPISTAALATSDSDMVIVAATCGNRGSYTLLNGFIEGIDQQMASSTGVTGHKHATGVAETPSADFLGFVNRQVIIGFVVQGTPPDPNKATNPNPANGADNVSISTDLSWNAPLGYTPTSYDVYFGTEPNAYDNPKYMVYTSSYNPPCDLAAGTTYYWAVDCNDNGTIYTGDPWSFRTFRSRDRVVGNMILINDNAGWCWYQDDKIIYDPVGGNVITSTAAHGSGFGGSGGLRTNDIDATTFNLATGKCTRVLMANYGGDDHNMGALWIRPDGRYLHLYCPHYSNPPNPPLTYFRVSTNANDGSAWNSRQSFNWSTISGISVSNGGQLTYTNVHFMSGEGTGSGRLYDIVRWNNVTPNIAYSDDWGITWQYMGRLNSPSAAGYSNYYHKFRSNGVDRIDFIGCEQHPRNYNNSVFHGYIKNGKSYDSYGNIMDNTLFDQSAPSIQSFTPVFIADPMQGPGTYHTGWTVELELDSQGYPVCLFQTRYGTEPYGNGSGQNTIGAADHRLFYARFDGSSWTYTELSKMGPGLHSPEQDYTGLGAIHPNNANLIYISTPFDPRDDTQLGYHEIFKGVTSDNGLSWEWTQITFDSTVDNIRPAIPSWDANNTAVFWTRGVYPGQENYDLVLVGIIDRQNETISRVTYIDANQSNTTNADGLPFTPTGPDGNPGAADDQWHEYTGYGNAGSVYTANELPENTPMLKTTISGLADGTYDVFAYFWCDPTQDWGVIGGFTTSDILYFNRQSSQQAEGSQFFGSVDVLDTEAVLYRVYIGRKQVSGGASIAVYIDDYDSSLTNGPDRTTYDGVGVARVIPDYAGDLYRDGVVNLKDIAVLGQDWRTIYDIYTLADIADEWLAGI